MKAGDIVWTLFPYEGKSADKPHPALVLDVLEGQAILAYGSSKHVDGTCPPAREVTVTEPEHLQQCGLRVPTRFDLGIRAKMAVRSCTPIGVLPQRKHKQLVIAALTCGLIQA